METAVLSLMPSSDWRSRTPDTHTHTHTHTQSVIYLHPLTQIFISSKAHLHTTPRVTSAPTPGYRGPARLTHDGTITGPVGDRAPNGRARESQHLSPKPERACAASTAPRNGMRPAAGGASTRRGAPGAQMSSSC